MIDWSIIDKKIKGTISEQEDKQLQDWMQSDRRHRELYEKSLNFYERKEFGAFEDSRLEKSWQKYEAQISMLERKKRKRIFSYAAAACALVLVSLSIVFMYPQKEDVMAKKESVITAGSPKAVLVLADGSSVDLANIVNDTLKQEESVLMASENSIAYSKKESSQGKEEVYNTIKTPRGGEFVLNLADGTKVWLNSQSVLRYPVNFKGKYRKVYLEGEAFFDVSKDKNNPFIVNSNNMNVKVLGTSFNIRNYKDEESLHTTLVEGSVVFKTKFGTNILKPGQQAVLAKGSKENVVRKVDTKLYTSWIDGKVVIRNEELESVMTKLSKWYDMEVFYMNDNVRKLKFYAHMDRYGELNELLEKFEKTGKVRFKIKKNIVYVYEK